MDKSSCIAIEAKPWYHTVLHVRKGVIFLRIFVIVIIITLFICRKETFFAHFLSSSSSRCSFAERRHFLCSQRPRRRVVVGHCSSHWRAGSRLQSNLFPQKYCLQKFTLSHRIYCAILRSLLTRTLCSPGSTEIWARTRQWTCWWGRDQEASWSDQVTTVRATTASSSTSTTRSSGFASKRRGSGTEVEKIR